MENMEIKPQPSTHYRRVVYIVYIICICVHISAGTGLKYEVYTLLKTYLSNQKS